MKYPHGIKILTVVGFLLQMSYFLPAATTVAKTVAKEAVNSNAQNRLQQGTDNFRYPIQRKFDPFMPFLNRQVPQPPVSAPVSSDFRNNFRLFGIIAAGKERVAIVEATRRTVTQELIMYLKNEGDK